MNELPQMARGEKTGVAETPRRPGAEAIKKLVERWKKLPRREIGIDGRWTGTYEDVLGEFIDVALGDYESSTTGGIVHKIYEGWEPEDFAEVFNLLGEKRYSSIDELKKKRRKVAVGLEHEPISEKLLLNLKFDKRLPRRYREAIYKRIQRQLETDPDTTRGELVTVLDQYHPGLWQPGGEQMWTKLFGDDPGQQEWVMRQYEWAKQDEGMIVNSKDFLTSDEFHREVKAHLPEFYQQYKFGDSIPFRKEKRKAVRSEASISP